MNAHAWFCIFSFTLLSTTTMAVAQGVSHSDVFFTYGDSRDNLKIEIAKQNGRLVIPQTFPMSGFFAQANTNPGFFSESDLGGGTGPEDTVAYNVLDDLILWHDGGFVSPKPDTRIRIVNNPSFVDDTIVGPDTGEQRASFDPLRNTIGQSGRTGEFHAHVDYQLEPLSSLTEDSPSIGAYGVKLSLSSDNSDVMESEPFFIVFGFGMDVLDFEQALDAFESLLNADGGILGDFDSDGTLSPADIDLLSAEALAGTNAVTFDLTNDGFVDQQDRTKWVENIAATHFGDADLNQNVEFADFLLLANGFGTAGGWARGDFNGNGVVDFPDFLVLSSNFGNTSTIAVVPEPNSSCLAISAMMVLATLIRRESRYRSWFRFA